ncbi:MAG TPA: TonB-dependent receptor plug domain-containing protein [Opitutaceae bacterium]|nr:TonB-dependent receptor plug domain-containing protein [Opitutaceae bacterium]
MKMIPAQPTPTLRLLSGLAALAAAAFLSLPANARAQASTSATPPTTSATPPSNENAVSPTAEVTLDPFTVTTTQDKGYSATNEISGSRVDTPIKDIPISIDVITSQFISDLGATNLRTALAYQAGIMIMTQNDLENTSGTFGGAYGPGGVNNPQGVTANPDESQFKIRGFITTNTLRDGFLRLNGVDSVNIDRIEVVFGPNALLYGTGNFGGAVDYLPRRPMDAQSALVDVSYGSYDFQRVAMDFTGPISSALHIDYRLDAAYETTGSQIDDYKEQRFFIAPQVSWRPTPTTMLLVDVEYGKEYINGDGFQAFRGVSATSTSLPTNNDQFEAVGFYYPPGSNPRSYNVTGGGTYVDTQEKNLELKGTQQILKEKGLLPSLDLLVAYNRSSVNLQTRQVNGEIEVDTDPTNNGYALSQTITTSQSSNSIGGQGSDNGNLTFGTVPNSVAAYTWNTTTTATIRDQERVELVLKKSLFPGKWYEWDSQVLAGYSDLYQQAYNTAGGTNGVNYKSPLALGPIVYGVQGDGSPDVAENINVDTEVKNWDSAYYLNYYAKLLNSRVIIMTGVRRDLNNSWDDDLMTSAGGVESATLSNKTYQNGVEVEVTRWLSLFALKADGVNPNFAGLRNAATGAPVSADTGKSNEYGIKFDAFHGKLTGTISRYTITKTSWVTEPWFAPAPLGHPRFNPANPTVYNLSDEDNPGQGMMPNGAMVGGISWPAASDGPLSGAALAANLAAGGNGLNGANNTGIAVTDFKAAVAAGAIYASSAGIGTPQVYINASTPTGAAYLDAVFAGNNGGQNGGWPGWMYAGMDIPPYGAGSHNDKLLNNGTQDAAGFLNTGINAANQVVDQSKGYEGQILYTPTDYLQFVFNASVHATVERINNGTWPNYPYTANDRWEPWFFANFGLNEQPLTGAGGAYTDPTNTSTHVVNVFPGDDTPKYAYSMFANYKFGEALRGLTVGVGASWHSQEEYFSGITHGSGQVETNAAGQLIVAYGPSQYNMDAFVKYDWKRWGYSQFVQLNVYNLLDDKELNGFIWTNPITAKVTYGIRF